jgi:inorganic triphosphatase YgiF
MADAKGGDVEVETELKIKLSPSDLEKVYQALFKQSGLSEPMYKSRPREYYDTPEMDFFKNHLSLRVQVKPGKANEYEQTVKVEMDPSGSMGEAVMRRRECKDDLKESRTPDLLAITDKEARAAFKPFRGKKLVHIFTAAIDRRYFDLELRNGKKHGTVEVAFDVGTITLADGKTKQDFFEIEVEVKEGGPGFIEIVKDGILKIAPSAQVQPLSKAMQGSLLYIQHKKPTSRII